MNVLVMAVGNNIEWECLWKDTATSSRLRMASNVRELEHTTDKLIDTYRLDNSVHSDQNEENIPELSPSEYASEASEHDSLIPKQDDEAMISPCDLKQGIEQDDLPDEALPWPNEAWLHAQCYLLGLMDDPASRISETGGGENGSSAGNTARLATPRHLLNASVQNTSTTGAGLTIDARHSAGEMTHATLSRDRIEGRAGLPPYLSEVAPAKVMSHGIVSIEQDLDYIKSALGTTEDSDTSYLSGECSDTFGQSRSAVKRRTPGRRCKASGKQLNKLASALVNEKSSCGADASCMHHQSDAHVTKRQHARESEESCCTNVSAPKCSSSAWVTKALHESIVALHQGSPHGDLTSCNRQDAQPGRLGQSTNYHYNNNNSNNNNSNNDSDEGCVDIDVTRANGDTAENSNSSNTDDGINSDTNSSKYSGNSKYGINSDINWTHSKSENNKNQCNNGSSSVLNEQVNTFDNNGVNRCANNESENKYTGSDDSCVDSRECDDSYSSGSSGPSPRGGHHANDRRNNNNSRGIIAESRRPNASRKNLNNNVSATNYAEQTAVSVGKEMVDKLKLARKKHTRPSELDETLTNGADIWWMRKAILVTYYYPNRSREHFPMCRRLTLRYVLYVVLVMICVASFVGTVYVGSNFSTALATKWLYYSGLGIVVQFVILEPVKVVLIAGFYAFVQKQLL